MTLALRIIDAHLHFWDTVNMRYSWLDDEPHLNRPFGPGDLHTHGYNVAGAVVVEAGCSSFEAYEEVLWLAELSSQWPTIAAVVAQAPIESGDQCGEHLARLAEHPLVAGVRRNLQNEAPGFAIDEGFLRGLQLLPDYGYTFDLCVRHWQLPEIIELVARVPSVTFVLDHLGKPAITDRRLDPWRDNISRLAAYPNVMCKLSGLTTEADPLQWATEDVLPYLRHAIAEFGADRCLVGSDWPVATLATTYGRWLDVVLDASAELSTAERRAILVDTAIRVYRLRCPSDTVAGRNRDSVESQPAPMQVGVPKLSG